MFSKFFYDFFIKQRSFHKSLESDMIKIKKIYDYRVGYGFWTLFVSLQNKRRWCCTVLQQISSLLSRETFNRHAVNFSNPVTWQNQKNQWVHSGIILKLLKQAFKLMDPLRILTNNKRPVRIYLFKIGNGNTRIICEVCSKSTIKT